MAASARFRSCSHFPLQYQTAANRWLNFFARNWLTDAQSSVPSPATRPNTPSTGLIDETHPHPSAALYRRTTRRFGILRQQAEEQFLSAARGTVHAVHPCGCVFSACCRGCASECL